MHLLIALLPVYTAASSAEQVLWLMENDPEVLAIPTTIISKFWKVEYLKFGD